ncbi:MAG: hypothetical protein GY795_25800 [Desulfobacterales bacterium]|nr:hypothetical protein [Desulfobacterales bacterium]
MKNESPVYYQDVEKCVDDIIEKVGKNIVFGIPLGLGKPNQLANELFKRAVQNPEIHLRIITGLTLEKPTWTSDLERRFLEPFVERLFKDYSDLEYARAIRRGELPPNVELSEFFMKPGGFIGIPVSQQNYISTNYTHAFRDILDNGVNVLSQMVAKQTFDGKTLFSLSCNPEVSLDLVPIIREQEKNGKKVAVIGQVNTNLPFMYGDAVVEPGIFDFVIDDPKYYTTLFGAPKMSVTTQDYMIGLHASSLIKDGGTLQIGIGSLGDALVYGMQMRHDKNDQYKAILNDTGMLKRFGDTINRLGGTEPFDEGLYGSTEMLVDGYLNLYQSGIIKRKVYNDVVIQRLINEGRVKDKITPDILQILLEEKVINPKLTQEDFEYLRNFGIIKQGWFYGNGYLRNAKTEIQADLSVEENLNLVIRHCLGETLENGVLIHAGFFLGPQQFYTALNEMSEEERKQIYMTSVLNVNQLYENSYAKEELKVLQRKGARFVNTALMFTMNGAVVSDGLENGQVVSGVGGQYNFVSMAHALPGGRSVLMAKSTRSKGKEVSSNIVWNYGHITIPRHLRDIVITEYGIAELRGKTDKEIIAALLNIADSRFQDELLQRAKSEGKLPGYYQIPDMYKDNLPQRLEENLSSHRKKGLIPAFPFGTDFTDEELAIGKALKSLKQKMSQGIGTKASSFGKAMAIRSTPEKAKPYLERLSLDNPATGKEKMMQKMVIYALASEGYV